MSLLRAFIAVEIPSEIQQAIHEATSSLRGEVGALVRWVPPENIHLTLKFLGDVSPAHVEQLTQMLRAEADSCPAFDIHVCGLGSFPNSKRARVIYIGIQAPPELEALYLGIESSSRKLGYESDASGGRGFSPHLTIGRINQKITAVEGQIIRRALEAAKIDSLGSARVDSVQLYKSELQQTGSVYTKLFSASLKQPSLRGGLQPDDTCT